MPDNTIFLRSNLNYDAKQRNNLSAISPDILPLYQTKVTDPTTLISTYDEFITQTVVPEEVNFVYTRGTAQDTKTKASATIVIGAVTNELVLWPQVLNSATKLGSIDLNYTVPTKIVPEPGVTASVNALSWKPAGQGGRHEALVAFTDNSFGGLKSANNYQDLLQIVGKPSTLSLYNAIVADPVFDVYTFTTRLRFFDDGTNPIVLELDVEPVGIPAGFSVALFSDNAGISLSKTALDPSSTVGLRVNVTNGFDALINVVVYREQGAVIPPDYSSISLVASVQQKQGHITNSIVIGAEHLIFDSSIRTARAIINKKLALGGNKAVGFYFRDQLTDTDTLPRTGAASHSPDIQPLGQIAIADITKQLNTSSYGTDVSDSQSAVIKTGDSNFIYLRGAANAPANIELSLYAIPNSLLITPDLYSQHGVTEADASGNQVLAVRQLNVSTTGDYVVDPPFNLLNPPPPSQTPGSDHYCLIAEFRDFESDPWNKPPWPHQDTFPTGADLVAWILGNPAVAWRNVAWTSDPNAATEIWQVNIAVDSTWSATDQGQLEIVCGNMPVGGSMQFQATASVGGTALSCGKTDITTPTQTAGVTFTGLQGPWNTTVTVSWWQNSGAARTFGSSLSMSLQKVIGGASLLAVELGKAARLSQVQRDFPIVIGPDYPHLAGHKRQLKLGDSHPLRKLPGEGRFDKLSIHPVAAVALGGDLRGVGNA